MHSKGHDVVFKDKDWGKRHDETNIHEGLLEFFSGRGKDASLISSILCRLSTVWKWFNSQRTFHFFASSLLFIYETDASLQANAQLVMIDFSHVFPANGEPDFNYLHGLENLIRSMNKLQEEFSRHDDQ